MSLISLPDLQLVRRRDQLGGIDDRRLRRSIESGDWVRIVSGVYVPGSAWRRLVPIERHRVRVAEVMRRMRPGAVVSHRAAAALHDIDILGRWPAVVDVTVERATGGRSTGGIRRHAWGLDFADRAPCGDHEVTTPAQTALDLARTLPFMAAVSAVDQAIWVDRPGGPLTTVEEIVELLRRDPRRRGRARARRVLEFTNTRAANVRESQNFVVVVQLGFPRPVLQHSRILRSGRLAIADQYFEEQDHWVEIDGRGKYLSPDFGHDRTPDQIVIDEKNRENEIRREVRGFSRWEATQADRPAMLYDILTGDGLRSAKPRP